MKNNQITKKHFNLTEKKMKLNYFTLVLLGCILFLTECKESEIILKETITITPDSLTIAKAEFISWRLKATVSNSVSDSIVWSSENPRIATVNEKGYVKGINAGITNIVATLTNRKAFAKCKVTVKDNNDFKFRLILRDKGTSGFSVNKPEEFLSSKSIERRRKQNLSVNETDLPISTDYIKEIEKTGAVVVAKSKWLKTVTIKCSDYFLMDKLKQLPFVEDVVLVWQTNRSIVMNAKKRHNISSVLKVSFADSIYGSAFDNINLNNGQVLHNMGFKGAGIDIAVIDEAFVGITSNPVLNNIHIKGAKSFIYEDQDPYGTKDHGVWTTSCMATNKPGFYVGTAPEANYWLLRSEDMSSEYPVEQDYWVAAIEYADSVGVDIVNTSLAYIYSDLPPFHYKYEDLDGKTEIATQGANMAADKGILVVCGAGNAQSWVGTPADSPNVLAVGSVNKNGEIDHDFSSFGLTVDGRIKPDVVSLGQGAAVIDQSGAYIDIKSGTSFSSPNLCGLAACLWQANPQLTNKQVIDIIKKSADRYNNPLLPYGYGIPNMQKAYELSRGL